MPIQSSPEVERRALALFERLADRVDDKRYRTRLLKNEPAPVLARVAALEAKVFRASGAIPTLIPGSADCRGSVPPPERVGAFRLLERIGRGGMGDVWQGARDDGLYEQKVAIKLIQRHALARAAAAFDDERRFLARLEHPNIARLIDGGVTEDGLPYLVMEFFEGRCIDQACEGLTAGARVALFIKAADAVQFAHSRMVAHADLKPGNIIVDAAGRVKLLDFGISGLIGQDSRSPTGTGPFTREFASPARLAGEGPSIPDDVYALGHTLFLCLEGADDLELSAIVAKARHADESMRYGSVAALIGDLDRWRTGLPVSAIADTARYRVEKFVSRHRWGVLATGVALVILSITSLVATANYVRAEHNRVKAEQRFGEVRNLSGFMLFDLYDALARQPGTVAKRAEIAETSSRYLERLQLSGDAPADLRLQAARSYRRLAAIQGLSGVSNLGEPAKAKVALNRAEALLSTLLKADPDDAAALTQMGWVYADRWTLHADNTDSPKTTRAARGYFDAALKRSPGDPEAKLGLLMIAKSEGYDLIWGADKPADALVVLKSTLAQLKTTKWPANLAQIAVLLEVNVLNRIGDATYHLGDLAGSLSPYREADALVDAQIKIQGQTPQLLIQKADDAFNISGTLGDLPGRRPEALAVVRAGESALQTLLRSGIDAAAEKKLLVLYAEEAALLDQSGQSVAALSPSTASITLREQRLARSPGDPQRMRDLAIGLAPYSELLAKAGRGADACAAATQATETWAGIKTAGHLGARDASKNQPDAAAFRAKFCTK